MNEGVELKMGLDLGSSSSYYVRFRGPTQIGYRTLGILHNFGQILSLTQ